ncbi:ABC transporter substrate-binding protein [Ochrobactrum teleogrylli]|uniref:ABC transporter substrate-binding protein n=1 Tax=Ochrobactrum teleogrylli TaxID=2479765 RepID=UPI00384F6BDC
MKSTGFRFRTALTAGALIAATPLGAYAADSASAPFKIGYITDATGPMQGTFRDTWVGFELYVNDLNASGGINGRKIEVQLKDVQSDTQKSVNAVHELASAGVSGIAGLAVSSTHVATYAAAEQYGLSVVAGFPPNFPIVLEPAVKHVFGAGDVFTVSNQITGKIARNIAPEGKRLACVSFEAPGSILSCETTLKSAREAGFTETQIFIVPQNQRDFRGVATNILNFNPDVVTDCFGQSHFIGLLPALGSLGYDGIYLSYETGIGDNIKRRTAASAPDSNFYTYSRYIAGKDVSADGEQAKKLQAAAEKAGLKEVIAAHSAGWVLGQIVADAFSRCEGECKPDAFNKALTQVNVDPGGLTGVNVKYTETDHYGPTAYRVYHLDREADDFKPVGDWYQLAPGRREVAK